MSIVALHGVARAQDTTVRGVTLIGVYDPSDLIPVVVLPVSGANGDSITAMLQRDLEFSDRVRLLTLDSQSAIAMRTSAGVNYASLAQLSAKFALDVTVAGDVLHFVLHDVAG